MAFIEEDANPEGNDFGICLAFLIYAIFLLELLFQLVIVIYYTIMHQGNPILMIKVRMSILICLVAMRGPSGMTDSKIVVVFTAAFKI